ncbi:MAG: ABC transporter substrate-binding protein [Anaerolineaceae bacterium]|nr:ABC transporter substrate-binding protein [Anaerolineaceae bacterium]
MLKYQQKSIKVIVVFTSLIIIASMMLVGCQPAETVEEEAAPVEEEAVMEEEVAPAEGGIKRGGTLVIGRHEEPLTFDPFVPGDNGSIYLLVQVVETLVRADDTGAGIEPCLAESWDISDDGLEYTFYLRDVKFSNGDQLTATDVEYSINIAATDSGYAFLFEPIDVMEVVDDATIKFTLKRPYTPFLAAMSLFTGSIVPKAVHEADTAGFGDNPVGTGPFMVEAYTRGEEVVLVPNPYYWEAGEDGEPLPYLDKIIIKYIPDSTSRVLGFRNNDYDAMTGVPLNEADSIKTMDGVTLEVAPIYRLDYLYTNHSAPPLDNREFRLALNYATDREAILKNVYFGYGELPNTYMPKMNFWSKDVPMIPYDPEKAKELLAESSYDGETIEIMVTSGSTMEKQTATMLQQNWSEVGINSEIIENEGGTIWDLIPAGEYMVQVSYITSDINDDDELATLQADYSAPGEFHSFFSWYDSAEVSDLLSQARQATDPAERAEYYKQAQEIAYYQDAYSIPFNFMPMVNSVYDYVQNWKNLTVGWWWLKDVWLDK